MAGGDKPITTRSSQRRTRNGGTCRRRRRSRTKTERHVNRGVLPCLSASMIRQHLRSHHGALARLRTLALQTCCGVPRTCFCHWAVSGIDPPMRDAWVPTRPRLWQSASSVTPCPNSIGRACVIGGKLPRHVGKHTRGFASRTRI